MNGDNGGKKPLPFPAASPAVPLVGQPFKVVAIWCPVNLTLDCNCGGEQVRVEVVGSLPTACPSCGKVYRVAFNPMTQKIEMQIAIPQAQVVS